MRGKRMNTGATVSIIFGSAALLLVLTLFLTGATSQQQLKTVDLRFRLRRQAKDTAAIVIVAIDSPTLSRQGGAWPLPRGLHAKVIDNIAKENPRMVLLDLMLAGRSSDPAEDEELSAAMRRAGCVTIPSGSIRGEEGEEPESASVGEVSPLLLRSAASTGLAGFPLDGDGVVRTVELATEPVGHNTPYALSLSMLAGLKGVDPGSVVRRDGSIRVGGETIPTDGDWRTMINFAGKPGTFKRISYEQVLDGSHPPGSFDNRIVLIGVTAPSLHEEYKTPFSYAGQMPGVEIQANALRMLIDEDFLYVVPSWITVLAILALGILAIIVTIMLSPWKSLVLVAACWLLLNIGFFVSFRFGVVTNVTETWLGLVVPFVAVSVYRLAAEEREKRRIRGVFSRYVDRALVNEIVERPEQLALGGTSREVTVLFCDIVGFTGIARDARPEEVVSLLNEYFTAMANIIMRNRGVLDKFMGDSVMAFFGAPVRLEDHPWHAVKAALEMREAAGRISLRSAGVEGRPLSVGIGVHTGDAVIGNVGSEKRMEYTAVGDTVNLASRLERLTRDHEDDIIISEDTYERVRSRVEAGYITSLEVSGRSGEVTVYGVTGLAGEGAGDGPKARDGGPGAAAVP